jgi:hypothetical protein
MRSKRTGWRRSAAPHGPAIPARESRGTRIDGFDLTILAAFAALSVWVAALDAWQVAVNHRVWTGTDGVYVVDQLQYLAWIRDASRHGLVSNLFVLHQTPADFLQPTVVISGGLSALGVAPWLSLMLWKPIAVAACFMAVRLYVARSLADRWQRRAALVLALFFGSATVIYGSVGAIGELFPAFLAWGYVFGLLALAAMVTALLYYERALTAGRMISAAGLLGALASWLHPWNGELLIVVVLGAEVITWRHRRLAPAQLTHTALTVVMTAVPLAYYALLGRLDLSWRLARVASAHSFPLWSIALEVLPLLVPALIAYRDAPGSFLEGANRVWPIAALAIFALSSTGLGGTPVHAFQGITIPFSVLAVAGAGRAGVGRLRHPLVVGWVAVAVFTVPATTYQLNSARQLVAPRVGTPNFITADERRALQYLAADNQSGGVISRSYLAALVPAATGRHTFVGDCIWSEPDCSDRLVLVRRLFAASLSPSAGRSFVIRSGARFLLADCRRTPDLDGPLRPILLSVHRFGCARVYDVR